MSVNDALQGLNVRISQLVADVLAAVIKTTTGLGAFALVPVVVALWVGRKYVAEFMGLGFVRRHLDARYKTGKEFLQNPPKPSWETGLAGDDLVRRVKDRELAAEGALHQRLGSRYVLERLAAFTDVEDPSFDERSLAYFREQVLGDVAVFKKNVCPLNSLTYAVPADQTAGSAADVLDIHGPHPHRKVQVEYTEEGHIPPEHRQAFLDHLTRRLWAGWIVEHARRKRDGKTVSRSVGGKILSELRRLHVIDNRSFAVRFLRQFRKTMGATFGCHLSELFGSDRSPALCSSNALGDLYAWAENYWKTYGRYLDGLYDPVFNHPIGDDLSTVRS